MVPAPAERKARAVSRLTGVFLVGEARAVSQAPVGVGAKRQTTLICPKKTGFPCAPLSDTHPKALQPLPEPGRPGGGGPEETLRKGRVSPLPPDNARSPYPAAPPGAVAHPRLPGAGRQGRGRDRRWGDWTAGTEAGAGGSQPPPRLAFGARPRPPLQHPPAG